MKRMISTPQLLALTGTAALLVGIKIGSVYSSSAESFLINSLVFSYPTPVNSPPVPVQTQPDKFDRARSIVSHGFHGPKSEKLYRLAYSAAYDRRTRNVHWVAERITKESLEKTLLEDSSSDSGEDSDADSVSLVPDRKHAKFTEDHSIPLEFRVKPSDYTNSGYDRGHLVPAADVVESQEAINETFLMSNMSPQYPNFNRGIWASFERTVRRFVKHFDELYVVTGPLYLPKEDPVTHKFSVSYEVIGRDKTIAVPTHFYKIILGVKDGKNYIGAFVLANEASTGVDQPLESFMLPVSAIERSTGLEFFPNLEKRHLGNLCSIAKCSVLLATKYTKNA